MGVQAQESHSKETTSLQMELRRLRLLAAELGERVEAAELEASAIRGGLEARLKALSKVRYLNVFLVCW